MAHRGSRIRSSAGLPRTRRYLEDSVLFLIGDVVATPQGLLQPVEARIRTVSGFLTISGGFSPTN